MLLREALQSQGPSLALQRAAADEIARLDHLVEQLQSELQARLKEIEFLKSSTEKEST